MPVFQILEKHQKDLAEKEDLMTDLENALKDKQLESEVVWESNKCLWCRLQRGVESLIAGLIPQAPNNTVWCLCYVSFPKKSF